ncbi:MAG: hypothetical protein GWP08_19970 [Nitrospiraceae bacterium]|nr:hypothetical protein [Nitrospiraceae bacterium]
MSTDTIQSWLRDLRVGDPVESQNLTVVPLLGGLGDVPEYHALDEALASGTLAVMEVDEAGSVPELAVQNTGEKDVLLLDGEELVGAKQNRILNLTILVAAGGKMKIPVSCVEQGRWRSMSERFVSGRHAPSRVRSNKERSVRESLRATGKAMSDQGQVWNDVEVVLNGSAAHSTTRAMADAFSKHEADLRQAAEKIRLPDDACGMAAFVTAELVVVDLFGYRATFQQTSGKLIDSYLLTALTELSVRTDRVFPAGAFDFRKRTAEILERAAAGQVEARPSVGLGTDVRITGNDVRGAALVLDEQVLHASLFPDSAIDELDGHRSGSRIASPRRRRRGRNGPQEQAPPSQGDSEREV